MSDNNQEDSFSLPNTFNHFRSRSYIAQDTARGKWSNNQRQQVVTSMDDLKPMPRFTPKMLKRPSPPTTNNNVQTSPASSGEYTQQYDNNRSRKSSVATTPTLPTNNNQWNNINNATWCSVSATVTTTNNTPSNNYNYNYNYNTLPPVEPTVTTCNYRTNGSAEGSPASSATTTNTTRPRTRDPTMDSVGAVKIAPALGRFEDLKSEAMNSWGEGVDLQLDSNSSKTKKKSEWLSQSAFFSDETPVLPTAAVPSSRRFSNNNFAPAEWHEQPKWQPVKEVRTKKQTYAEIADRKTPEWALDEVSMVTPQLEIPYGYHQQPWAPTAHTMQHHVAPMVMMPSPYMSMPPNMYSVLSPRDSEHMCYFYLVLRDRQIHTTLKTFQKKVEKILQRMIHELSPRSFGLLMEALVVVMKYEFSQNQLETARRIRESWHMFIFYYTRHLQMYAKLPEDLLSALQLGTSLQHFAPKVHKELPMMDVLRVYESVKDLCTPELKKECIKHLRLLKAMPDDKDGSWRDLDERLPSVPVAEDIVLEVVNKVNVLEDYETKKEMRIVNKVHNPWPNMDLLNYTLVHFMMLRDELLGPVQSTIEELFSGKPSGSMEMPNDCAVFEKTSPRSTTMLVTSSEPAIVFTLGPPLEHDEIMESFEEGSFVVLLPETTTTINPSDRHTAMIKIAKGAMMGQAVRASSYKTNDGVVRLVSIHIKKDDIARLDWSAKYTLITCRINAASTISVLQWLHKEYVGLKKDRFSSILTPRILAAKNILSKSQLTSWDEENTENALTINQDAIPDYLANVEIDIACVLATKNSNYKARPGENIWPRLPAQWENVAPSKRPPLYSISPSQFAAVKFAMCHRIAVISGAPGTGKTYIASKLAQLMSEALSVGQFHQPVLVIAKSQSCLDTILTNVVANIPDVVRFGSQPWDEVLVGKQAIRLAAPGASDNNYRQHQHLERQLSKNQMKLNALHQARFQAAHHDPSVLSTAIAPQYLHYLQEGYMKDNSQQYPPNHLSIWTAWAAQDPLTKNFSSARESHKTMDHAQWNLETSYLKKCGRGLMPMVDNNLIQSRFQWVANNPVSMLPIAEATNWPFENSARAGSSLRSAIFNAWKRVPAEQIWKASKEEKSMVIEAIAKVLITHIDLEIQDVLQDQIKTAKAFDDNLVQKWTYLCRFNRVIGMTSDFAATHRDWVSCLWPRAVIIDEASEILESTLASTILGHRTEHVVLLGNSDNLSKPHLSNTELAGNPRNLDVSLFERWKGSGSEMVLLEEQWRMHSEVASVIDQFNSIKSDSSGLLITAPLASCSENMVDGHNPQFEKLFGITQRAFYVNYQASTNTKKNVHYSSMLKIDLTEAEVDEARYVAFFAVYLSQQPYPQPRITILTTCLLQKYLIRAILRDEVPKRTCFKSNVSKISLDTIEQNSGRQDMFTIVSTATPSYSFSTWDNVSCALTRSICGLFVIGKPEQDDVHPRWKDFAEYMEDRQLFGDHLQLTCYTHGDTFSVGKWQDFDQMKNGGCSIPCHTLMSDGHVCQEVCHFMSHDEIVCQEPCNRLRPSICNHVCKKKCFECSKSGSCPPCEEETTVTLDCGHSFTGVCHTIQNLDALECQTLVPVTLSCGHEITIECCKTKKSKKLECDVKTDVTLECGHRAIARCGISPVCTEVCNKFYECGHACQEMCGMRHSHEREECIASCPKQLICGHGCANGCANPDRHTERCTEKCNYVCSHGYKCSRECWKDCIKCVSACPYSCEHYKCTKKCYEICDRPPCNQACKKRLGCSHICPGLCGEPCPPCIICNGNLKCSISLRTLSEFERDEKVYTLPECECVFSVESLDMYFQNQAKNGQHTAIKLWGCPSCQKTIYRAFRYNKYIKTEINLVNTIKMRLEKERQKLTHHEKAQIINAMNDETRHGAHNMVGGRWFVCKNQHPYFIGDCGGATQISKCPECDAPIGGTQHKVVDSNRFYGEFDGSEAPAWPGQPGVPPQ